MKTKEPPYTERYVRWCGRSVDKIIIYLLPDYSTQIRQIFICLKIFSIHVVKSCYSTLRNHEIFLLSFVFLDAYLIGQVLCFRIKLYCFLDVYTSSFLNGNQEVQSYILSLEKRFQFPIK